MQDLCGDPRHARTLEDLGTSLDRWTEETDDFLRAAAGPIFAPAEERATELDPPTEC